MRFRFIALVSILVGAASPAAAQMQVEPAHKIPGITVVGYGAVETAPDLAVITYTLRGEGKSSDDAVRAMVAMGSRIDSSVASVDPTAESQTDKVEVTPVKGPDCKERDYGAKQMSTGVCATVGYVAEQDVTIRTSSVKDAGTLVGLVGRSGAEDAQVQAFALRDPSTAARAAIAAAIADAQVKAAAAATGSHLALGPISNVSIAGGSVQKTIIVTGARTRQPDAPMVLPPVVVNLNPEAITTEASVTVTYAIGR